MPQINQSGLKITGKKLPALKRRAKQQVIDFNFPSSQGIGSITYSTENGIEKYNCLNLLGGSNGKLSKDDILTFSLPALLPTKWNEYAHQQNREPFYQGKVCNNAGTCASYCYALRSNFANPNVSGAADFKFYFSQMPQFEGTMVEEIKRKNPKYVRIHDSGDFYSYEYSKKWMNIANQCQDVIFYAYTKEYSLFFYGHWNDRPHNLKIIYSAGAKDSTLWPQIVGNILPHAIIEEHCPKDYTDCSDSDMLAIQNTRIYLHPRNN